MSENILKCSSSQECHEKNHLCRIILDKDLGRVRQIVKDSQYYCKNCGRAAHDMNNLCSPAKI